MKNKILILAVLIVAAISQTSAQIQRCISLAREGNFDEALQYVKNAEKQGVPPKDINYFYGCVYFIKGDCPTARSYYTEAINLAPDDWHPYFDRAAVYSQEGSYNQALKDINEAINLAGEHYFYALNARGVIYAKSGRYKLAMNDFNSCISQRPDNPDTYINIGNMLMQQKKYAEAEQQYTKAISLDANNISAYNNRANAREMLFDLDGAQADTDTYNQLIMR
jgi:pentatricopeptide repeat protein